ncbi:MAG TPA: SpoIIE family protein phosphatase [Pyrinomonadaceae bacterium]|jgi:sigma-B regulation protein RsbU (phosphoserine phosphatase)
MTAARFDPIRLEALLESAQLLHSSLNLEDLLRHLLRSVMGRLLVSRGLIAVEDEGEMRLALVRGIKGLKAGEPFDETAARAAGIQLILPIGQDEHPVGFLGISRPPGGEVDAGEEEFLKALLGIAAGGIANARAHAEAFRLNQDLDQKVQELRALLDLVRGLTSTLEPDAVASLLMFTLAGRWAVRKYAVAAWREGHPTVLRQKGMAFPDLKEFQTTLQALPEAATTESLPEGDFKEAVRAQQGALIFPLRSSDASSGVVILGTRFGNVPYTDADLEFGTGLVAQAAVAFENSWYVRETLERKKIEQELALAATIQQQLFPESLPRIDGYDLAAHNRPARQCGGDYYDALPIVDISDHHHYLFCVADVSGKGLPASLLMSNMQATLRALLGRVPSLADLAARTNELLHATTPSNKYVTAVLVQFDPVTGTARYVNAGHNGGLLLRGSDGEAEWLKPTGTPLGLLAGLPYEEATIQLQPGDLLALFSDGIPEAQDASENEFGEEKLLIHLREIFKERADTIVARVFQQIDIFAGATPQYDDITLMVIKRGAADGA